MISAKGEPNDPEAERPNSIIDIESARSKKLRAFLCAGGRFAKIITITKNKLVIKKLAKKKYYIQVCAYKVNSNGKKVKGKWSAKKAIKVKK